MSFRRTAAPAAAAFILLLCSAPAGAQATSATLVARVVTSDGASAAGARLDLLPVPGTGAARSITITASTPRGSVSVPAGAYRLRVALAGFHAAERTLDLLPGILTSVAVRLEPSNEPALSSVTRTDRQAIAYQTAFDLAALGMLPSSRTAWSLLETSHPFLISDRIDGGGIWSAEPSALGGQGSSSAQTTYRLDGFDVTDPDFTGTPLFYPDLAALDAVVVP
jgi:hypothetical protein